MIYHVGQVFIEFTRNETITFFLEKISDNSMLDFFVVTMTEEPRSVKAERVYNYHAKDFREEKTRPMRDTEKYSIWRAIFWYAKG